MESDSVITDLVFVAFTLSSSCVIIALSSAWASLSCFKKMARFLFMKEI